MTKYFVLSLIFVASIFSMPCQAMNKEEAFQEKIKTAEKVTMAVSAAHLLRDSVIANEIVRGGCLSLLTFLTPYTLPIGAAMLIYSSYNYLKTPNTKDVPCSK